MIKRFIALMLIAGCAAGQGILPGLMAHRNAGSDIASDLVAYWPFDGTTTDTAEGHTSTGGGTWVTGVNGVATNACNIDSKDSPLIVNDDDDFSFVDGDGDVPFTISFWYKPESSIGNGFFPIEKSGEWSFQCVSPSIKISLSSGHGNAQLIETIGTQIVVGTWAHWVLTYDGSENQSGMRLYLDGVLVSTDTSASYDGMANTAATLLVQKPVGAPVMHQIGDYDDLRIYRRELKTCDIDALFHFFD